MIEGYGAYAERVRLLLGADFICFWSLLPDGSAQVRACSPTDWLDRPFAAPGGEPGVTLARGESARRHLPMQARRVLPGNAREKHLVVHACADQANSGLFAAWLSADAPPSSALLDVLAANWAMVVKGQDKIDRTATAWLQLGALVDALPLGVAVVSSGGRPGRVNLPAAQRLGLPAGEVDSGVLAQALGQWVRAADNHPDFAPEVVEQLAHTPARFVARYRNPESIVDVAITPIAAALGLGWVWLLRDMTKEQQDARRLQQALDEAALASSAKSAFLATMSHELRTPLNALSGFGRVLEDTLENSEQQRQARFVREAAETLTTILNDVLDAAKIEAGKFHLDVRPFSMGQVVDSCASPFRVIAVEKHLDFEALVPQALPELMGDPVRVRQVLTNLLSNAFKFTAAGGVRIVLDRVDEEPDRDREGRVTLRIRVVDTGIGMTPEQLDRLFKPFEQASRSTAALYGGTGLGLSIVKALVDMMGGAVEVRSAPGEGTTFSLLLPFECAVPSAQAAATPDAGEPPMRVLVVDDFHVNRAVLRALLQRRGHAVTEAEDGLEAVDRVCADPPDLVFMDLDMPRLDGLEATRRIRQLEEGRRHTPIVALTGKAFEEDIRRTRDAGMDAHVAKPVQLPDLVRTLRQFRRRR